MLSIAEYLREEQQQTCDFRYVFKFRNRANHFEKLWQMKISARESLDDWLLVSDIIPHTAETCANACSELIENCIKYGQEDAVAVVAIHVTDREIVIETINTTAPDNLAELADAIQALAAAADPKQVFIEKLMHPVAGKSHLGLSKIVMETKGALSLVPHEESGVVHVKLRLQAE